MPKVSEKNLLDQPYRDRQVIVVLKSADTDTAPVSVRLRDYYSGDVHEANATLKNWLSLNHWTNSKTWGVYGFAYDRLRGKTSTSGAKEIDHFVRISADVAERIIKFPVGHPRYDMVYVGHPLRPSEYIPIATFHRHIFEDKFNELIALLSSLGATKLSVSFASNHKRGGNASLSLSLVDELLTSAKGSFKAHSSSSSEGSFEAEFTPVSTPSTPTDLVWFDHESTWQNVANARLNAGLTQIDVALRYEDDFGIDAKLAVGLEGSGLNIGGAFTEFERTVWTFTGAFSPL